MSSSYPAPTKREKSPTMQRLVTILISFLALASAVSLITLSSPNTLKFTLPQKLSHRAQNIIVPIKEEESCDLSKGSWVREQSRSVYNSTNCRWIPDWKNCFKYGRRNWDFVNWRWKPQQCELPRFDPTTFLDIVKGKQMMFIGDSVARNQVESLLCLLSQEEVPNEVYSEGESGSRTLYFPSHNFTLVFIRSIFLVKSEERVINGSNSGLYNLYLDEVDTEWADKLPGTDYAVVSDAHWFFRGNYLYENKNLIGCSHCSEPNIASLGIQFSLRKALQTVLRYINECRDLRTLLRTFSPAHFENGTWNSGGYCNRTSPLSEEEEGVMGKDFERELSAIQREEIERLRNEGQGRRFGILDVTKAMLVRADGHPGIHWNNQWSGGSSDCLHWCLPGPIDTWNDMLLAVLAKEAVSSNTRARNQRHP